MSGLDRFLFASVFLVNFALVVRYRRAAQSGEQFGWKKEGVWIALPLRAAGLCGLAYIVLCVAYPPAIGWSLVDVPNGARWAAAAAGLIVIPPVLTWAQSSLGRNVSPTVITREQHTLVTHGPYRWIRHPLYSIGMALYSCLAVISGSWLLIALLGFGVVMLLIRLPKEEAELAARFGQEYEAYRVRTGRFVPRLRPR